VTKNPKLGDNLRRIVQSHLDEGVRDPLGLDAKLIEYFMSGKAFVFSKSARRLAMEILKSEDIRQTSRSLDFWHASSTGDCRRKQIIAKRYPDFVRVDPLTAIQRMDDGKWGHLKWQLIFHELGLLERCEYLVHYRPWNAGGSPDGELVLRYRDPDTKFLLEIKRVSSYRFANILRTQEPERPHILQTHTYIQATDLTNIIYFYENKDTNDWRIFWQKRDLDVIKYLRRYFNYLNDYEERGKVPPPDCTFKRSDKMFLYCEYKKLCIERLKKAGLWEKYGPATT
jgi:hypothetical protein